MTTDMKTAKIVNIVRCFIFTILLSAALQSCQNKEWDISDMRMVSATPEANAMNVPLDTRITVTFSKQILASSANLKVMAGNQPVSGSVSVNDKTVTFTPSANLQADTDYTVIISADTKDAYENHVDKEYQWTFHTAGSGGWFRFLGATGFDVAYAIDVTTDGGCIVAGYATSDIPNLGGKTPLNAFSSIDLLVVKLGGDGSVSWYTFLGGAANWDAAHSIKQTADGGYIVAGYSGANIPTLGGKTPLNAFSGINDGYVIKLTAAGAVSWYTFLGGSGNDTLSSINQTSDGGFLAVGHVTENVPTLAGKAPLNAYVLNEDAFVVKLTASGNVAWYTFLGGSGMNDRATTAQETSDGGYIIAGEANANIATLGGKAPLNSYAGNYDVFIIKLTSGGAIDWYTFLGGASLDTIFSMQQTADAGFILAGYSYGIPSLSGQIPLNANSGNTSDFLLLKLTSNGALSWYTFLGGSGHEIARSVKQTADGGYIVAGLSDAAITNLAGKAPLNPYSSATGYTTLVTRLTAAGAVSWYTFLGDSADYQYSVVAPASDGAFFIAGSSTASFSAPSGKSALNAYSALADIFVVRLTSSGSW